MLSKEVAETVFMTSMLDTNSTSYISS